MISSSVFAPGSAAPFWARFSAPCATPFASSSAIEGAGIDGICSPLERAWSSGELSQHQVKFGLRASSTDGEAAKLDQALIPAWDHQD